MEQSHGNAFQNVPVHNFTTGILSKYFALDMKAEKFSSYPWYQEVIEQELSILCFKQKPVFFQDGIQPFFSAPWQKDFIPYLNVWNWWVLWAELLTSIIIRNLETTLWSEQQLSKLYNQLFDQQLWGK